MKALAAALVLSLSVEPAWARPAEASGGSSAATPGAQSASASSEAGERQAPPAGTSDLPVSIDRIKRQLARAPRATDDPLRLQFYIEVYGKLPPLALFPEGVDLQHGAVPYSGPTHQDILNQITPQEFRAPAADLTSLASLIARWLGGKKDKKEQK